MHSHSLHDTDEQHYYYEKHGERNPGNTNTALGFPKSELDNSVCHAQVHSSTSGVFTREKNPQECSFAVSNEIKKSIYAIFVSSCLICKLLPNSWNKIRTSERRTNKVSKQSLTLLHCRMLDFHFCTLSTEQGQILR